MRPTGRNPDDRGAIRWVRMPARKDTEIARLVGRRMRDARFTRAYTIEQAAERLGVAATTWARWESADRTPDLGALVRIAAVLAVTPGTLLPGEPNPLVAADSAAVSPDLSAILAVLSRLDADQRSMAIRILRAIPP